MMQFSWFVFLLNSCPKNTLRHEYLCEYLQIYLKQFPVGKFNKRMTEFHIARESCPPPPHLAAFFSDSSSTHNLKYVQIMHFYAFFNHFYSLIFEMALWITFLNINIHWKVISNGSIETENENKLIIRVSILEIPNHDQKQELCSIKTLISNNRNGMMGQTISSMLLKEDNWY